jgi:hypothetical protein
MPLQLGSAGRSSKRRRELSNLDIIARIDDIFCSNGYQSVVIREENVILKGSL